MKDTLGDRIKSNFEDRTRYHVPRRTYTILRLDGCHFHTYTKRLNRPFDSGLIADMDAAIVAMLPQLQGVVFAYTQSDEISILLTDFEKETTSAWFDGNLQKMCSVSASILTAEFNRLRVNRNRNDWNANKRVSEFPGNEKLAYFDCRVFTIPDRIEVMNMFRWRQQDCIRNSVSMVAQSNFKHTELQNKSQSDMHDMLHAKGVNWATDFTDGEKNGRIIVKESYVENVILPKADKQQTRDESTGIASTPTTIYATRTRWVANGAWVFTKDEGKLLSMIPKYE
jgi:tRNA(His) 5'-end guanylyltransferase